MAIIIQRYIKQRITINDTERIDIIASVNNKLEEIVSTSKEIKKKYVSMLYFNHN